MTQQHCDIVKDEEGVIVAFSPELSLVILPDGPAEAFNRNAIHQASGGHRRVLVGELNGVRCYVSVESGYPTVLMTTQDLYLTFDGEGKCKETKQ